MIASVIPRIAIATPQISMIRMLSQRPLRTAGNESTALSQLKNVSWTRGHPSERVTSQTMSPPMTIVEAAETSAERVVRARR
jgi:hypothetical protein